MKPTGKSNDRRYAAGGLALAAALAAFGVLVPTVASAQMIDQNWNFKARDRAGLAVVMKQAESGMFDRSSSNGSGGLGSASSTFLVCGGDGGAGDSSSQSTANSSCIILNNATGDLNIGQDAAGDQSANTSTQSSVDQVQEILEEGSGSQAAAQ